MADRRDAADEPDGRQPKRRKIRKGTRSCWACKRRKVRCIFSEDAGDEPACEECRRRGMACVSQDQPEERPTQATPAPSPLSRQMDDKLGRMEALVEMLVKSAASGTPLSADALRDASLSTRQEAEASPAGQEASADMTARAFLQRATVRQQNTPSQPAAEAGRTYTTWFGHQCGIEDEEASGAYRNPVLTPTTSEESTAVSPDRLGGVPPRSLGGPTSSLSAAWSAAGCLDQDYYTQRYNILAATWPTPADLDIIIDALSAPARAGLHMVLLQMPYSPVLVVPETALLGHPDLRSLLVLPPPGTHLVLVALRLLSLATFLQHMHPRFDPGLARLSVPHRDLMQRAVCSATRAVLTSDNLVGSLEGLLCLVMEGIYQSNLGNLRRAWLSFRRATAVAQLMGLPRGSASFAIKTIDPATRNHIHPACLWFRIVYADRYLSLLLGLPQGIPGDGAVTCPSSCPSTHLDPRSIDAGLPPSVAEARQQLRGFEALHAVIVGRIIDRNEAWRGEDDDVNVKADGLRSTRAIDVQLQRASRSMPPSWWLAPSLTAAHDDDGGAEMFIQTHRAIDQLFHYYLITQLHLPYMLRRGHTDADDYTYSKITCVSASREVLSRFLALRSVQTVTFFCRSIDFFALLASMTLCLAHLDSHRRGCTASDASDASDGSDFLLHQRLSDRGMMERVLESMDALAALHQGDPLSEKSAAFLRRMLAIEDDACYAAGATMGCPKSVDALQDPDRVPPQDLRIWVPFLGTIRIGRAGIFRVGEHQHENPNGQPPAEPLSFQDPSTTHTVSVEPVAGGDGAGDGGSGTSWPSTASPDIAASAMPGLSTPTLQPTQIESGSWADEWTLQGVDLAFFENLFIHGSLDDLVVDGTDPLASAVPWAEDTLHMPM